MSPGRSVQERIQEDGEVRLNSPIEIMRFTLVYEGSLPSQGGKGDARIRQKHAIRKELHSQLAELWMTTGVLKKGLNDWKLVPEQQRSHWEQERDTLHDPGSFGDYCHVVRSFSRQNFTFIPLVTRDLELLCELDILFLRAEPRGTLFTANHAGDLDNRLKVLFDALRVPGNAGELPATAVPGADEEPFFCLLEDDRLITVVRLESERLLDLKPPQTSDHVSLVMRVTVKAEHLTWRNIDVIGAG